MKEFQNESRSQLGLLESGKRLRMEEVGVVKVGDMQVEGEADK
jgi:hypothetical protein